MGPPNIPVARKVPKRVAWFVQGTNPTQLNSTHLNPTHSSQPPDQVKPSTMNINMVPPSDPNLDD